MRRAYESPIDDAAEIAGHLSFYPDRTQITVDGQPLARRQRVPTQRVESGS